MLADNDTPLASLALEQLRPDGRRMAVVVVRYRIELDEDGQPNYAEPQELVLSDCCSGDPQKDPLIFASDLVPSRHAADVTFRGSAHAAEPQQAILCGIDVEGHQRSLCAVGPLHWEYDKDWRLLASEPVTEVPVCYRLANGGRTIGHPDGEVDPRNPIGSGIIHPDFTPRTISVPAPQIEAADDPCNSSRCMSWRLRVSASWHPGGRRASSLPARMTTTGAQASTPAFWRTSTIASTNVPIRAWCFPTTSRPA